MATTPAHKKPNPTNTITDILTERGSNYGSFDDHAAITQSIKRAMKASRNWTELNDAQKESLEMIAHKIGRVLNGDPNYLDSWVDIEGYTHLVVKLLQGQK